MILLITEVIIAVLCGVAFLLGRKVKFLAGRVRWGFALTAVLFAVISGVAAKEMYDDRTNYNKTLYLAAKHLSDGNVEVAKIRLNSLSSEDDGGFEENILGCMVSKLQGDEATSKLALVLCQKYAGSNEAYQTMVTYIQNNDITQPENRLKVANYFLSSVCKKPPEKWTHLYALESAAMTGGTVQEDELESYSKKYGEDEGERLRVSLYLATGDINGAFEAASKLVEKRDSKQNRLLLAETMAQLYYTGSSVNSSMFKADPNGEGKPDAEVAKLQKKADELLEEQLKIETKMGAELDDSKVKTLTEQRDRLVLEQDELIKKKDNIYLYRAVNSMEGCGGVEPDIMMAKLYFAAGENKKATETIKTVSANKMSQVKNSNVRRSMERVSAAFSDAGNVDVDSYLLADVENILMSTNSEVVGISALSVTKELAAALMSEVKYNPNILYISSIDTSEYPKISVMINGSDEMIAKLSDGDAMIGRDTRNNITYTMEQNDSASKSFSTCFVVDESGSMQGSPIENAKAALSETVKTMAGNTKVAIVGYDSEARVISPVTSELSSLLGGIATLGNGGGTNIASGLISGLQVLENAPGVQSMVLMTDGQDSASSLIEEALDTAKSRGIVIYTVGFGDVNDQLLSDIALATGGQYIKADSSSELTSIYFLLQSYIGNTAKLSYTVSANTDETDRYLYLGYSNGGYYARRSYTLPSKVVDDLPIATLSMVSPSVMSLDNVKNGISLTIRGMGMDQVTAVRIDGNNAVVDSQQPEQMRVSLAGELQSGIYGLELELSDGSKLTNPMAFAVGERLQYGQYHIGNLTVRASAGVAIDEYTLAVGNGISINDSIRCDNLLILELPEPLDNEDQSSPHELGNTGVMKGCTDLYIQGNDYSRLYEATYRGRNETVLVATGEFECTITSDSSSIQMKDVQGEVAVP